MLSKSEAETRKIASTMLKEVTNTHPKSALVIGLVGNLGAGKTFFVRSFLRELGINKNVTSPTFVLMREYPLPLKSRFRKMFNKAYHVDAYRLNKEDILKATKLPSLVDEKKAILLIEWADRIKKALPKETIWVKLIHGKKENERKINFY